MAYKKYIYKNGKRFGPYYYESYRDKNGKIRKRYVKRHEVVSKTEVKKDSFFKNKKFILILILLILSALLIFLIPRFTGHVNLEIQEIYSSGEYVSGDLILKVRGGELIPENSKLIAEQQGFIKEFNLSDFIDSNSEGDYYVSGEDIDGDGKGFGFIGENTEYSDVYFTLVLEKKITGRGSISSEELEKSKKDKEEKKKEKEEEKEEKKEERNKTKLTSKESELLRMLCLHLNNTLERGLALRNIWGDESYFSGRSMDVFISKLRKYLKDDKCIEIVNIHGKGFRLIINR